MQPYILKETIRGIQQIAIEDELLQYREIFLVDTIERETAATIIKQLMYLEKSQSGVPITLYINSPGGEVDSGLAIYDYIELMKSPVNTVCIGTAASMGAILFLAGKNRKMFKNSQLMIHDPSFLSEKINGKKPAEIQERLDQLIQTQKKLATIISQKTNLSLDEVLEKTKQDTFLNAKEALKYNLATEILESEGNL